MMSVATPFNPERILELLSRQRDLYQELRELSVRQRGMITGESGDQLLALLRQRQNAIADLTRINEELGPYRREWETTLARMPTAERVHAGELLNETNNLLRTILRADEEDSALLAARKQAAAREMTQTSSAQSANSAYSAQSATGSKAISADWKG